MAARAVSTLPRRDLRETLAFDERLGFENRGAPPEEWRRVAVERDPPTGSRHQEPTETDHGMREFALVDRSGNLIRVGSPLS